MTSGSHSPPRSRKCKAETLGPRSRGAELIAQRRKRRERTIRCFASFVGLLPRRLWVGLLFFPIAERFILNVAFRQKRSFWYLPDFMTRLTGKKCRTGR